jgi:dTDP-4-dehydrorhamnose 3,5-epimerase
MQMLRSDALYFQGFGEIYFSLAYPGIIKGWRLHQQMLQNYAVPLGMIKLVIYDGRPDSPTQGELMELFVGEFNYVLVTIPAGVWNGFQCLGVKPALVANCTTIPHYPQEVVRLAPFDSRIPYRWL